MSKQDLNKVQTSDYISKSSLLNLFKDLADEHETNGISYKALNEVILQQPTVDEKEIIRKAFERVVEKIDDLDTYFDNGDFATCDDALVVLKCVLQIVKEEGGNE